jgi:hypothetical protein
MVYIHVPTSETTWAAKYLRKFRFRKAEKVRPGDADALSAVVPGAPLFPPPMMWTTSPRAIVRKAWRRPNQ